MIAPNECDELEDSKSSTYECMKAMFDHWKWLPQQQTDPRALSNLFSNVSYRGPEAKEHWEMSVPVRIWMDNAQGEQKQRDIRPLDLVRSSAQFGITRDLSTGDSGGWRTLAKF